MIDRADLVEALIERVTRYVVDPPRGDDLVIDHASPAELVELFGGSVGLAFDTNEPAADDSELLAAIEQTITSSVHTSHPRFVNQNFAGPDPISVIGDWLGAALNTTGATYEAAPVFTLMESAVLTKLARIAGYVGAEHDPLPTLPHGLFCAGGSMGTLFGLQLARHRLRPDITTAGATGEPMAIFVSDSGHYAARKSAALLGVGTDAVIAIETDSGGAMRPDALEAAVSSAVAMGRTPLAVVATAGTTVTSAFDPLNEIADICEARDVWLHVDGCYGGSALFSPDHAWRLDGIERSDSFVWNLHKMMGMTQQCTALLVKRPEQLAACFAAKADYLFQPDKLHADYDSGDRTFQCARRIDVLKLWLTWKARGDAGFADRIDHAVAMANHTRRRIAESKGAFATVVDGDFTNVVFAWVPPAMRPVQLDHPARLSPDDRATLHRLPPAIKATMQVEGSGLIGFQPVHGLNTFRMICMSPTLQTDDVDALLRAIDRAGLAAAGAG